MDWSGRLERARGFMEDAAVDVFFVTDLSNIRYLTGFSGSAGVLLVSPGDAVLFTDFRYDRQAADEVHSACSVRITGAKLWEEVLSTAGATPGCRRAGFEAHATTVSDGRRYREGPSHLEFEGLPDGVGTLRASKEPAEVEAIRAAAAIATEALKAVCERGGFAGKREIDVAAELEHELRTGGSEWHPFETIVASGERSALPHARTSERVIRPGDFLLFDFGATVGGYCSDVTRTIVVGTASKRQRSVYEVVRKAQAEALEGVRAGMTGRRADEIARSVISREGYGDNFGHSLGHGIGLDVHEAPRLASSVAEPIPGNAVVTIEPGVYLSGWGGVRIEDDVYLDDRNCELLSEFDRELIEIE